MGLIRIVEKILVLCKFPLGFCQKKKLGNFVMNSKNFIVCQVPAYSGPIEMVDSLEHIFVKFIGVFFFFFWGGGGGYFFFLVFFFEFIEHVLEKHPG